MTGNIQVSKEYMYEYAGKFEAESQNMEAMITNMYQYVQNLQDEWKGQAAYAFEERLNELKPNFDNIKDVIAAISNKLKETGNDFDDADQQAASGWSA